MVRIVAALLILVALYWWVTSSSATELRATLAGLWVHGVMGL